MEHRLGNEELHRLYDAAGMGGRSGFGERPALLVIDMAHAWTRPGEVLGSDLSGVLDEILGVLDDARAAGIPVVFTTMAYDPALAEVSEAQLRKTPLVRELIRGSELVQLAPELNRAEHEPFIEKPRQSAFFATRLETWLVSHRIDTAIVVGCSTSGCIRSTCEDAVDLGYHVVVPREAVGDRSRSAHEAALFDIDARFGDVMPVAEVRDHLVGTHHG
jgi:nicotinamidase-related amidase